MKRNGISYIPTNCVAQAAGANRMKLAGETKDCIMLKLLNTVAPVILNLGRMIVVNNLGVDILIGEPGKADNEILTIPHKQKIEFKSTKGKQITVPYSTKWLPNSVCAVMCKSEQIQTIYPGHQIQVEVPFNLRRVKRFSVTPSRSKKKPWIKESIVTPDHKGNIFLHNGTDEIICLSKHEHYATLHPYSTFMVEDIHDGECLRKIYDLGRRDLSHLIPDTSSPGLEERQDYLDEISLDPDNILSQHWKEKFYQICKRFSHIINPKPGKYNGFFGRIDNSINFASIPPHSVWAHLPKYGHDMLQIMAKKWMSWRSGGC